VAVQDAHRADEEVRLDPRDNANRAEGAGDDRTRGARRYPNKKRDYEKTRNDRDAAQPQELRRPGLKLRDVAGPETDRYVDEDDAGGEQRAEDAQTEPGVVDPGVLVSCVQAVTSRAPCPFLIPRLEEVSSDAPARREFASA